jgi:hypothetical protein
MMAEQRERNPGDEAPPGTVGTGEDACSDCRGTGRVGGKPCETCGDREGGRRRGRRLSRASLHRHVRLERDVGQGVAAGAAQFRRIAPTSGSRSTQRAPISRLGV